MDQTCVSEASIGENLCLVQLAQSASLLRLVAAAGRKHVACGAIVPLQLANTPSPQRLALVSAGRDYQPSVTQS
eukprot:6205339-Pleurochrysis_carterae.AAC.3